MLLFDGFFDKPVVTYPLPPDGLVIYTTKSFEPTGVSSYGNFKNRIPKRLAVADAPTDPATAITNVPSSANAIWAAYLDCAGIVKIDGTVLDTTNSQRQSFGSTAGSVLYVKAVSPDDLETLIKSSATTAAFVTAVAALPNLTNANITDVDGRPRIAKTLVLAVVTDPLLRLKSIEIEAYTALT
jgi:hypothetical protein